ncbi:MAG: cobyrinate a,c-diamide synthase [Paracoccaceae bacterium]|nr:cobyrinate a,c-diamide synthase [Paracoccaceae bacterium]MDG2257988.1 cobyrinate a,c-diamide synthase [Paracoccaceae bacterium]
MTSLPRFMIAAAHKSSGKTVVSTGIARALLKQGQTVGTFKKGPDYIDPLWLSTASRVPCYNLDFNTMGRDELTHLFSSRAQGSDINLIEANKGLFDGTNPDGTDSNAELAKLLKTPVVLVIDTVGMTRGIAPLLLGYLGFDPDVNIAGVILNRTGGPRHSGKLVQAVETYTDLPVLGAIRRTPDMDIAERHLGLITPAENPATDTWIDLVSYLVAEQVNLDTIQALASDVPELTAKPIDIGRTPPDAAGLKIGIAKDAAFGFYYSDDLEAFSQAGASLVPIDMLHDQVLPEIDALFIGGGFPETQASTLAANRSMLLSVNAALDAGLRCYAECGGLMYLCNSIGWGDERSDMVGFFDADTRLEKKPQGRGYVRFDSNSNHPWGQTKTTTSAHEFHYARIVNSKENIFTRDIKRGHGTDGLSDGLLKNNTLAGFVHLRHSAQSPWVFDFLDFVLSHKK